MGRQDKVEELTRVELETILAYWPLGAPIELFNRVQSLAAVRAEEGQESRVEYFARMERRGREAIVRFLRRPRVGSTED